MVLRRYLNCRDCLLLRCALEWWTSGSPRIALVGSDHSCRKRGLLWTKHLSYPQSCQRIALEKHFVACVLFYHLVMRHWVQCLSSWMSLWRCFLAKWGASGFQAASSHLHLRYCRLLWQAIQFHCSWKNLSFLSTLRWSSFSLPDYSCQDPSWLTPLSNQCHKGRWSLESYRQEICDCASTVLSCLAVSCCYCCAASFWPACHFECLASSIAPTWFGSHYQVEYASTEAD